MKLKIAVISLVCAALVWFTMPEVSLGEPESYDVLVTAYTCHAHPRNPMYPCGPLRWGGDIDSAGMACPVSWRNRVFKVPGFGVRRCDDTPAEGYIWGLPHIDLRVPTYGQARWIGVRRMTVHAVGSVGDAAPLRSQVLTPEAAIKQAHALVPTGDADTAMARLLRAETAKGYFPTLLKNMKASKDDPLWLVTIWVPPSHIPAGASASPNPAEPIAAQMFVLNPHTGQVVIDEYVSSNVVTKMGWIPSDKINLGQ